MILSASACVCGAACARMRRRFILEAYKDGLRGHLDVNDSHLYELRLKVIDGS